MPSPERAIEAVFLDIGGTLGERDRQTGVFTLYPSSVPLLKAMRDTVGLRIGVITTLGPEMTNAEGQDLLARAGLADFLDPNGFVSDHDAGTSKPNVGIYQFAARKLGIPAERCLFIGENLIEVGGAVASGMKAILKPTPPGRELAG